MPTILIIDDEPDILNLLSYNLKREGYDILTAPDGLAGKDEAFNSAPDLIILDLMLPEIDGLALCRILRGEPKTAAIPILMLTAKSEELDKIVGLEMGADDYVTKPFSPREVAARVKALLRRAKNEEITKDSYSFASLSLDMSTHEVNIGGKKINLSPLEFRLLKFFVSHLDRVYSRDQLLDRVWGDDAYVEPRTVDVHVRRLREKIKPEGDLIKTVRGAGYRFSPDREGEDR